MPISRSADQPISRAAKRLIVVCAEEVLEFVPSSAEMYDAMGIWKRIDRMMSAVHERLQVELVSGTVEFTDDHGELAE